MVEVCYQLYTEGQVDPSQVSVHSAFICLLHLANEKGLEFNIEEENDFKIFQPN
jgi:hypothetical protein